MTNCLNSSLKWNFWKGGEVETKNPSMGRVWLFSETMQQTDQQAGKLSKSLIKSYIFTSCLKTSRTWGGSVQRSAALRHQAHAPLSGIFIINYVQPASIKVTHILCQCSPTFPIGQKFIPCHSNPPPPCSTSPVHNHRLIVPLKYTS